MLLIFHYWLFVAGKVLENKKRMLVHTLFVFMFQQNFIDTGYIMVLALKKEHLPGSLVSSRFWYRFYRRV